MGNGHTNWWAIQIYLIPKLAIYAFDISHFLREGLSKKIKEHEIIHCQFFIHITFDARKTEVDIMSR